ncbi:hypothetical protein [Methanobrevibacter sp. DSM 116169]|uniref:hypothetical protein n=1 Tax=Methanobrevibacter sp. DSM 116169 TaxID=3242727 RepID=UPI0038FC9049
MIASDSLFKNSSNKINPDSIKQMISENKKKSIDNSEAIILKKEILGKLDNNQGISTQLLSNFINSTGEFFLEHDTLIAYKKTNKGFQEFNKFNLATYFNETFGKNRISINQCHQVLGFITHKISRNSDLLVFKNGTFDTEKGTFKKNEFPEDELPKLSLDFNYNSNANWDDLHNEIEEILKSRWEKNSYRFYRSVGNSLLSTNELEKITLLVGPPGSRKSTLLEILKRIFKDYSNVSYNSILNSVEKEFALYPLIGRSINIEDDVQTGIWKNVGRLNSFVTGTGLEVRKKHENEALQLNKFNTPKGWGGCNALPPIVGDGMGRRLLLILCENPIDTFDMDSTIIKDIVLGKRDDEIEGFIHFCLKIAIDDRKKPLLNQEEEKEMLKEWIWKSDPTKIGVELVFMDEDTYRDKYSDKDEDLSETFITVADANKEMKRWHKWALKNGKIFNEHKNPTANTIKGAMDRAGFTQNTKRIIDENGESKTAKVYEDCIISPEWIKLRDEDN